MIKALIEIGNSLKNLYPMPLIEVPYPFQKGKREPKAFVIDLISARNSSLKLDNITLMDYSLEDSYKKYFFRSPSSAQGPAASLSFKLPGKSKALRQRLGIFKTLEYEIDLEELAKAIESKHEEFKSTGLVFKDTPILLVFRVDRKWPSENEKLKESFAENFLLALTKYKSKPIWKRHGICHGCDTKTTIYGGIGNLFKVYTVDKYGYAPELNPKASWKQYALCEDCIFNFERGKRAIDDFLTYFFLREILLAPPCLHRKS